MSRRFEFCRVCRQNHNQGRRHRYSTKHKHSLELALGKLLERIQDVRQFVKNVVPVTDEAQEGNKFWCHICEQEISEEHSLFVCEQAINHFASQKHAENVKSFWAEHGGVAEKRQLYVIEGADLARWEEACKAVPALVGVQGPLLSNVNSQSDKHSTVGPLTEGNHETSVSSASITSKPYVIGTELCIEDDRKLGCHPSPYIEASEGNVHSGAVPPWVKQNIREGNALVVGVASSSSHHRLPLSRTQERKLAKIRNPNRVGDAWAERRRAELEMEQRGEVVTGSVKDISSWFPSFGRVWQSGSRRDTRKEFEAEKHLELGMQGRRGKGLSKNRTSSVKLKPYISRKQRMAMEIAPG